MDWIQYIKSFETQGPLFLVKVDIFTVYETDGNCMEYGVRRRYGGDGASTRGVWIHVAFCKGCPRGEGCRVV